MGVLEYVEATAAGRPGFDRTQGLPLLSWEVRRAPPHVCACDAHTPRSEWRVGEHVKLEVKLVPQPPLGATATLTGGLGRQVACFCAFVAYPAAVLGLRVAVRGATYDTDAGWLRAVGVALGLSLRWPLSELGS